MVGPCPKCGGIGMTGHPEDLWRPDSYGHCDREGRVV
jgi:hypothetical protein